MDLDDLDRALLALVLDDAARSDRELARLTDSTAPTVKARLARLADLRLVGPARTDADLTRLGTLVWVMAPPEDAELLAEHPALVQLYRTQQNRVAALVLLAREADLGALHRDLPKAETHVLRERLASRAPPLADGPANVPCSQCGKAIEGEGLRLTLGGRHYVACCPSCEARLEERYGRHAGRT